MKYLLDSVIMIDHLNGISKATQFIAQNADTTVISVITRAEILVGSNPQNQDQIKLFLDHFFHLPITIIEADMAAQLRRQHSWKLPDALQAAIASCHNLKLVTRNTKDFSPSKHPFVFIPYKL